QAVGAAVEATAVRIDDVAEAQIRTVVFGQHLLGVILEQRELDLRPASETGLVEVLDEARRKTIARVGGGDRPHPPTITEQTNSVETQRSARWFVAVAAFPDAQQV